MGDFSQDDIDKLLSGGLDGIGEPAPEESAAPPVDDGPASQDDIDALFAAVGAGDDPVPAASAPAEPAPEPAPEPEPEEGGVASQGDIDALFAAVGGSAPEPAAHDAAADALPADLDTAGTADQNDIDALFAAVGMAAPEPADAELATPESAPEPVPAPEPEPTAEPQVDDSVDISALLDSIEAPAAPDATDTAKADTVDMSELLNQINSAAPPLVEKPAAAPVDYNASTMIISPDALAGSAGTGQAPASAPPPVAQAQPPPAYAPPPAPAQPLVPPPSVTQLRDSLSVMSSAGEVESMASQISGMLGQLSEKAHRYMQAWLASDSEAKELRTRLLNEEHLRAVAIGEKDAFGREVEVLRGKIGALEGDRIGADEARRTAEAALQTQIRELESRAKVQEAEIESLKNELTRSRTEATGVDIESRRARFEADRLKSEVESERMERMRIQRALENREKELQAMQAQASGQASSLFIDELHRLVRRLESELDVRGAGAHEALRQLDRLEYPESMVPVVANLRASLMHALGADGADEDALKSLGREAERVRGPQALAPGKTEMLSFESALSTYNLTAALEVAGALLREIKATPAALMRRIYQSPALRRPEVAEHLADLARLLEGLRTVQESADRARGSESGESEVFYVQMFDFLHNLVRLKLVNRLTGEMWRIFLDLRGRFSFVTSDKQWADYRDGVLGEKVAK